MGELESLGASWLTLTTTLADPVAEHVLRELASHRLELVVGIDVRPIATVEQATLAAVCRHYARAGVHYLYLFDRPNLASEWRYDQWAAPGLVGRFAELLIPALAVIARSGLVPMISPLAPGGDYWDTSFLAQLLGHLAEADVGAVLERIVLGAYAVRNRPIGWGHGGPGRWRSARPYVRPSGTEDHRGLRLFEWYKAIAAERLGQALPVLYVDTCHVTDDAAAGAPSAGPAATQRWALEAVDALRTGDLGDDVLSVGLGQLTPSGDDDTTDHWYSRDCRPGPLVGWLKSRPRTLRSSDPGRVPPRIVDDPAASRESIGAVGPSHRPIAHCLLLLPKLGSSSEEGSQIADLIAAAAAFIARVRPTVAFRVDEAMLSRQVTVIGTEPQDLDDAERKLREAGCRVDRIVATSASALMQTLHSLAEREGVAVES